MKILLDENVTVQLPLLHTFLQEKGYDVVLDTRLFEIERSPSEHI